MLSVKIINTSNNPLPAYETIASAGMDIRAFIQSRETIKPFERKLIPTGLFMELPSGYEAQVRPRSGLALKYGITVLNAPGTIDADYRGEIKVLLINLSQEEYHIENGDRIAQMIISQCKQSAWNEVEELTQTERAGGGYGHTGVR